MAKKVKKTISNKNYGNGKTGKTSKAQIEEEEENEEEEEETEEEEEEEEEYDNTNRGVLFKNKRKRKKSHPDYTGTIETDNQKYWLAAWIKKSPGKAPFLSLAITPQEDEDVEEKSKGKKSKNDDLPF